MSSAIYIQIAQLSDGPRAHTITTTTHFANDHLVNVCLIRDTPIDPVPLLLLLPLWRRQRRRPISVCCTARPTKTTSHGQNGTFTYSWWMVDTQNVDPNGSTHIVEFIVKNSTHTHMAPLLAQPASLLPRLPRSTDTHEGVT